MPLKMKKKKLTKKEFIAKKHSKAYKTFLKNRKEGAKNHEKI